MGYVFILFILFIGGFVIGFTHELRWSMQSGLQGGTICLGIGMLSLLFVDLIK